MTVNTSGGSTVYIHRPDTATNPRYLNRLTGWVPIGEVESLSEIGETFGTIQRTYFSRGPRTESMKTVTTGKSVQLSIGFDVSDAGQTLLREAFTSRESYLFRVEINDAVFNDFVGTRLIFRALVTDQPFSIGSSDSITYRNASIQINSEVFELPSESDIDADTSMIFDFVNNVARIDSANAPSQQTIAQAVTFTRASPAMYFDSTGTLRTAAANQIRFDHNPVTREPLGFLVEGARTNLVLRNTTLDVLPWGKVGVGATVTDGAAIAPNGLMEASRVQFNASVPGEFVGLRQTVTGVAFESPHVTSIWMRADTPTTIVMRGGSGGSYASLQTLPVTTSWQRYIYPITSNIPATGIFLFDLFAKESSGSTSVAKEIYMWCPQLEAGSFVSSEIITGASQVTRAADNMTFLLANSPWNDAEGSVLLEFTYAYAASNVLSSNRRALSIYSDGANRHLFFNSGGNKIAAITQVTGSGTTSNLVSTGAIAADTKIRAAYGFKVNDFALAVNGAAPIVNTSGALPAGLTTMSIGFDGNGNHVFGHVSRILLTRNRMSNDELQAWSVT